MAAVTTVLFHHFRALAVDFFLRVRCAHVCAEEQRADDEARHYGGVAACGARKLDVAKPVCGSGDVRLASVADGEVIEVQQVWQIQLELFMNTVEVPVYVLPSIMIYWTRTWSCIPVIHVLADH